MRLVEPVKIVSMLCFVSCLPHKGCIEVQACNPESHYSPTRLGEFHGWVCCSIHDYGQNVTAAKVVDFIKTAFQILYDRGGRK